MSSKSEQENVMGFALTGFNSLQQAREYFRQALLVPIPAKPTNEEEEEN